MHEIKFQATIPRYLVGLAFKSWLPSVLWSGLSCLYHQNKAFSDWKDPSWVRIRTRYGGICGSDLGAIHLDVSPYLSSMTSFPYTLGHENVGYIDAVDPDNTDWEVGERVVVEPTLWCRPRGFEDLCVYCARGEINRCERITGGNIAAGLMIGACRDTGGSWSSHFFAHKSQLYRLPNEISDENALMIEPFAVGLHAALQYLPGPDQRILLIGGGSIGLCTLAALRALGSQSEITILVRHPFQQEAASKLGADHVYFAKGDYFTQIARHFKGELLHPIIGKSVLVGGADITFECVGKAGSLDDALRMTRNGGTVSLVGVPGIPKNVDWTAIFIQELEVKAAYIYNHAESLEGKNWKTFDLAIDLMKRGKVDLSWMVTHKFDISEYRQALSYLKKRGEAGVIKAAFKFDPSPSK